MSYVDGFVIPVPEEKLPAYLEMANKACEVWIEYGALQYVEAVSDDLDIDDILKFSELTDLKEGEVVIFAWIMYESREHRDEVNEKVRHDPRIKGMCDAKDMPFEMKRMAYGGFKVIVES